VLLGDSAGGAERPLAERPRGRAPGELGEATKGIVQARGGRLSPAGGSAAGPPLVPGSVPGIVGGSAELRLSHGTRQRAALPQLGMPCTEDRDLQ